MKIAGRAALGFGAAVLIFCAGSAGAQQLYGGLRRADMLLAVRSSEVFFENVRDGNHREALNMLDGATRAKYSPSAAASILRANQRLLAKTKIDEKFTALVRRSPALIRSCLEAKGKGRKLYLNMALVRSPSGTAWRVSQFAVRSAPAPGCPG